MHLKITLNRISRFKDNIDFAISAMMSISDNKMTLYCEIESNRGENDMGIAIIVNDAQLSLMISPPKYNNLAVVIRLYHSEF
jgi:hypothetical protein